MPSGIPHAIAEKRGICGAQRKDEDAPCEGPREGCPKHCGSKKKSDGGICSQRPMPNGRCRMHSGNAMVGAEHPNYVDGTYSKYRAIFTGDALEHYEAAVHDDGRYLELKEDLHVLDTLFYEELKRARVGEGGALWQELGKVWTQFESADPTRDATSAGRALRRMGELISEGVSRQAAQSHALEIHEHKRRTSETERKRVVDQERTITQVQAMSFAAGVIALLREAVAGEENEREILARFHVGATRLVQQYVGGAAGELPPAR